MTSHWNYLFVEKQVNNVLPRLGLPLSEQVALTGQNLSDYPILQTGSSYGASGKKGFYTSKPGFITLPHNKKNNSLLALYQITKQRGTVVYK